MQDLLVCLNLPEWPSSSLLLELFCSSFTNNLGKNIDSPLRTQSLDLLGTVLAKVRQDLGQTDLDIILDTNSQVTVVFEISQVQESKL